MSKIALKHSAEAIKEWLNEKVLDTREERVRVFLIEQTRKAYDAKDMKELPTIGEIVQTLKVAHDMCSRVRLQEMGAIQVKMGVRTGWALVDEDK